MLLLGGCTGLINTPAGPVAPVEGVGGGSGSGGSGGGVAMPQGPDCTGEQAMRVPIQRLSVWQYERVVRDALGPTLKLGSTFPLTQTKAAPYSTFPEANPIGDTAVKGIAETAEALADAVTDGLPACTGAEPTCARSYFSQLASKLFRRAPTQAELDRLVALFTAMRADFTYRESVALGVAALLQHPQTLYMVEQAVGALDHEQVVARLALLYLGGLPDPALQGADVGIAPLRVAEAKRMMATAKGKEALSRFVFELLMLEGFTADQYPAATQAALLEELHRLVEDAVKQPNGFKALLTSNKAFVNTALEGFYKLPVMPKGPDGWREVSLPPDARVGVLTHPLLMSRTAHGLEPSIILRGKFVRNLLLCQELANPPAGATAMQPDAGTAASIRESSAARSAIAQCKTCHQLMDPLGFGFLQFDGAGALRPAEDGHGEIIAGGQVTGTFNGARELGTRLAASDEVARCFAKQWLRYAFGKREAAADVCAAKSLGDGFVASGKNLETLCSSLAGLDAFSVRKAGVQP